MDGLSDENRRQVIQLVNEKLKSWLYTFIATHLTCFASGGIVGFFVGKSYAKMIFLYELNLILFYLKH